MATTDSRTGFRLPWSTDNRQAPEEGDETRAANAAPDASSGGESYEPGSVPASPDAQESTAEVAAHASLDASAPPAAASSAAVGAAPVNGSGTAPSRRPNKFLADLTRAMQAAAEAAREESLGRLSADARSFIEQIHERSAEEAAGLRNRADADIEEIREWSKAEIARIREETEGRITDRRTRLESETERHAAQIEREIERVQARVSEFETEMARFFERLLAEEDPTRFASMAENLPEPPSFDVGEALAEAATLATEPAAAAPPQEGTAAGEPAEGSAEPAAEAVVGGSAEPAAEAVVETPAAEADTTTTDAADDEAEPDPRASVDAPGGDEVAPPPSGPDALPEEGVDPRLAVLGLNAEFAAAAEAEASAFDAASAADDVADLPDFGDDTIAARLAGFLPETETPPSEVVRTQVVVVGLVSVASIAGFKRHLGRLDGVQSVGVSSGPDGEFVFAVTHADGASLADAIPTIPGFQARVTGIGDNVVNVTAHDPESDV